MTLYLHVASQQTHFNPCFNYVSLNRGYHEYMELSIVCCKFIWLLQTSYRTYQLMLHSQQFVRKVLQLHLDLVYRSLYILSVFL